MPPAAASHAYEAMRSDLEQIPDDQLAALYSASMTLGSFVDALQR